MTTLQKRANAVLTDIPTTNVLELNSETYIPQALPRFLRTRDMIALYIMAVFWMSNVTGVAIGGAAAFTYWLICAVTFFIPCAIVTAQLGILFPFEGSIYNWTYKAFGGRFWGFFIGFCAWLPGVLSLVSAADVVVNCLQTLNPHWLVPVWQQGTAIILITLFCGYLALQRARTVQYIINITAFGILLIVLLIGLATVIWLQGHHSITNFADSSSWAINPDPRAGNISLLGTITLALLGATMPLNMGGEIKEGSSRDQRRIITGHLLWGTLIVLLGYFVLTFAVLAVEGQTAAMSAANPVVLLVGIVQTVMGPIAGSIVMIGIMLFFLVVGVFENCVSSRLLLVAGIDRRLPRSLGKLNKSRIPGNAIVFQTVVAVGYTVCVFFLFPYVTNLGDPVSLTVKAYTVTAASLLLVWAFSFIFPFVDLAMLYFRNRKDAITRDAWLRKLIFPAPLLIICVILGPITCIGAMLVTLTSSWIPFLISSDQWGVTVGLVTLILLVLSAVGSMYMSSQVGWEEIAS